ncbi:nucleoside hydrolase-like domain-containing protein [Paenibacillus macerans]|uniref:nucleoside hydrolase-like domain-containing protein n=1 Tax=Paenibacillus macerans TaxID=44252 RepID=UPI00203E795A|nr:nucleoside hydrolase-like domain-containing protein [Paenibacillus macerans]MCM3699692.1 DUF1593 domain-containing protein [Paenibacillus macerans]
MHANFGTTYRVLVSTDLGGDPDDIQSLVHLLHYSDILKLEGIISSTGPGSINKAEGIKEWVRRTDLDFLRQKGYNELLSEEEVLSIVKQGAIQPGEPGEGKSTEGSAWIVKKALAADPLGLNRPLWVLAWGSLTDIAQALYDAPEIAERIRIYYISSTNTVHDEDSYEFLLDGMEDKWPNLWWIENGVLPRLSHDTFRGYYLGGDQSGEWGNLAYLETIIRPKGTTRNSEFTETLGQAFPGADWPEGVLKEGDTPTFLYLLSPVVGGVGDVDDPTAESWGGQFRRAYPDKYPNYFIDLDASAEECQATINKWRVSYLADWKKRWLRYDE